MKRILYLFLTAMVIVFFVSISYVVYQIERPTIVMWDKHDPKLHGQNVVFNAPMAYLEVDQDKYYGLQVTKETDFYLIELADVEHRLSPVGGGGEGVVKNVVPIKHPMKFEVAGSFWIRTNWITQGLGSDRRILYLIDENGVKSVAHFLSLTDSDRSELADLRKEGRFDFWFIKIVSLFAQPEKKVSGWDTLHQISQSHLYQSFATRFLRNVSNEEREEECRYLQKEVDELNLQFGGQLRGKYRYVPEELRTEIARLVKINRCKIEGDTVD